MASKSPAKPWESSNSGNFSSPIDSSGTNNSVAKHSNNPHINRKGASSTADKSLPEAAITPQTNTNTVDPTTTTQNPQPIQSYNSNLGMNPYGGGMYGNSMYGGGMGMYGGGMYGGGMYGNGMYGNPMMGGMGPMGPMGFMQMSVNNVGRFSQLLQMGAQALHMTFSSLVQFAGNIGMLAREFGGFLTGVHIFRFLKWVYLKIKKFIFWLIGRKPDSKEQFEEMFQSAAAAAAEKQNGINGQNGQNSNNSTHYSWLSIGFYCFGIMYVIQWIYKTISFELDQKKKMEEQQQQQQQGMVGQMAMNPYQNMGMNPYGGYVQPTGYGMSMNPYGQPMMQQPMQQLPQTQQINNPTDSAAKKGDDTDKSSDSLLAKPKDDNVQNLSG